MCLGNWDQRELSRTTQSRCSSHNGQHFKNIPLSSMAFTGTKGVVFPADFVVKKGQKHLTQVAGGENE